MSNALLASAVCRQVCVRVGGRKEQVRPFRVAKDGYSLKAAT